MVIVDCCNRCHGNHCNSTIDIIDVIPSTVYDVRGRASRIYEWTARIYINIP